MNQIHFNYVFDEYFYFRYILQNIIYKLEILNGKSKLSEEQNFMEAPEVLMKEIIPIIPNVLENFIEICNILVDVLKECDYIKDANVMYFEKTMQAKTCLFLLQKLFSSIFGWTGFTISKNKPLFKGWICIIIVPRIN